MKRYLVGGAVRDSLLGLPVKERDWVVVGATPEEMAAAGYLPVGKDFPVFLHPQTKEEHALARTERKSGRGYKGFTFHTGPEVTLEEDLIRRDLTVNAIAQAEDGTLTDPYGGQRDLQQKVLRHVSGAFLEDPVRILRVARFHSRFATLGFVIADETLALMREMVANGEVNHLVPERIWQEMSRALMQPQPGIFFQTLRDCGALARILPELDALFGVPQRADYHPEVDSGIHTLMCVDIAARLDAPLEVRVAALLHDLGKALTPKQELPSHKMHEVRGLPLVEQVCDRLRIPNSCRDLSLAVTREHINVHRALELRPETLLGLIDRLGAFRRPGFFENALCACECDSRGRKGYTEQVPPELEYLRAASREAALVQAKEIVAEGFSGEEVGVELAKRRAARLKIWTANQSSDR